MFWQVFAPRPTAPTCFWVQSVFNFLWDHKDPHFQRTHLQAKQAGPVSKKSSAWRQKALPVPVLAASELCTGKVTLRKVVLAYKHVSRPIWKEQWPYPAPHPQWRCIVSSPVTRDSSITSPSSTASAQWRARLSFSPVWGSQKVQCIICLHSLSAACDHSWIMFSCPAQRHVPVPSHWPRVTHRQAHVAKPQLR